MTVVKRMPIRLTPIPTTCRGLQRKPDRKELRMSSSSPEVPRAHCAHCGSPLPSPQALQQKSKSETATVEGDPSIESEQRHPRPANFHQQTGEWYHCQFVDPISRPIGRGYSHMTAQGIDIRLGNLTTVVCTIDFAHENSPSRGLAPSVPAGGALMLAVAGCLDQRASQPYM